MGERGLEPKPSILCIHPKSKLSSPGWCPNCPNHWKKRLVGRWQLGVGGLARNFLLCCSFPYFQTLTCMAWHGFIQNQSCHWLVGVQIEQKHLVGRWQLGVGGVARNWQPAGLEDWNFLLRCPFPLFRQQCHGIVWKSHLNKCVKFQSWKHNFWSRRLKFSTQLLFPPFQTLCSLAL